MPVNDGLIAPYGLLEAQIQTQAYWSVAEYYLNGQSTSLRANLMRDDVTANLSALSTGVMTSTAILLYAGDPVTNLTFVSGATALATGTHWWFALYDTNPTPQLLGQTADQTSSAWAANTAKTLALATPYTVPTTGIYYAAVNVTATTPPTLVGSSVQTAAAGAVVSGMKILAQTSGSSLTATAPTSITSATTVGTVPLVIVT